MLDLSLIMSGKEANERERESSGDVPMRGGLK